MNDKMSFFQITKPEGQNRNVDLLVNQLLRFVFSAMLTSRSTHLLRFVSLPEGMRQRKTSVTTKRRGNRFSGTKKPKEQNRNVDLPVNHQIFSISLLKKAQ
jgi:hypothetical protein